MTSLCTQIGQNAGTIDCDPKRRNPRVLLVGGGYFQVADYANQVTMDAAILAKLKLAASNGQKLFPFPLIEGVADKTEAAKYASLGYGLSFKVMRSKPGYEFDIPTGSSTEKKLMAFDGQTMPIYIIDDAVNFWGVRDSALNFRGAKMLIGVEPQPFGDAAGAKTTKVTVSYVSAADFVENACVYDSALSAEGLVGLKDVIMSVLSKSSNVYKIKLNIPTTLLGGDMDIYDDYAALIAALTFTAFTGANYTVSLPITSVAVDATLKALTVTFDTTAFGLLGAGASIKLVAPLPPVLDAANVTGLEIATLFTVK